MLSTIAPDPQATTETPVPRIVYERHPGAASASLPPGYCRRQPEKTILHQVVREHLETFLEQGRLRSAHGDGYPRFIEKELRRYLSCGLLPRGFCRLRCPSCGTERLVAFSCKGRLCPSCVGRRMSDIAAQLVDHLFPEAPYRQWVLSFPWPLRFRLSVDKAFLSDMLRGFLRTLFAWQRRRGRALGIRDGQSGAVTFLQRFGGALNANPHCHSVLPDGLFVPAPDGPQEQLVFTPLPPLTDADVRSLTEKIARRLTAVAERHLQADSQWATGDDEQANRRDAVAASMHPPLPRQPTLGIPCMIPRRPLCAVVDSFSLHAARHVAADDRAALERLCRYGLRAPFCGDRLSLRADGKVVYHLRRPWPTPAGATALVLEPLELLRRLAAILPTPNTNLVRYHGVLANRSRFRHRLPSPPRVANDSAGAEHADCAPGAPDTPASPARPARLPWAMLLRRSLGIDALRCPQCSTPMVVLAFITGATVVRKILNHLGLLAHRRPYAERLPTTHSRRACAAATCPDCKNAA